MACSKLVTITNMRFKLLLTITILCPIIKSKSESIESSNERGQPEFWKNSEIVSHDICSDWTNHSDVRHGKCSCSDDFSLRCYDIPSFKAFGKEAFNKYCSLNTSHHLRPGKVRHLIFCGWPNNTFDPSILPTFPRLRSLLIERGALQHINVEFPHMKRLKHIRIRYTQLTNIRPNVFKHLPSLTTIDLRWNQLDHYDGSITLPKKVLKLYLSENPYNCSNNFKWLLNQSKAKHIIDRNSLQCADSLFKNQSIQNVVNIKVSLREMCQTNAELRNCTCILSYISLDLDGTRRPMYSINCSNLNLYRLPASVPENTTTFYAQHNRISNVEALPTAYRNVHDIYLDYNRISAIESLETDNWLERFRMFSLKGNQLTKLPVYLLNNALERNIQASEMYLSGNPWRCECNFMLRFQELLQRHRAIIKDATEIQCINRDEDETTVFSVLALKRSDVCILSTDYMIQPIDMLNGVLATLIILIIVKLSYDYYNFRAYGHLPWIVTKMP